jgi:hypothetical protein
MSYLFANKFEQCPFWNQAQGIGLNALSLVRDNKPTGRYNNEKEVDFCQAENPIHLPIMEAP